MANPIRYFSATDGVRTCFRASSTMAYVSGECQEKVWTGQVTYHTRFSKAPGLWPAKEITKAEFNQLMTLKQARTKQTAPWASWIMNSSLPAREG